MAAGRPGGDKGPLPRGGPRVAPPGTACPGAESWGALPAAPSHTNRTFSTNNTEANQSLTERHF